MESVNSNTNTHTCTQTQKNPHAYIKRKQTKIYLKYKNCSTREKGDYLLLTRAKSKAFKYRKIKTIKKIYHLKTKTDRKLR